ncbi:hypothetical protein J4Q44_G00370080 [Coregonus suidteri]|uniref:Proline-rich protein 5 n=1 Tax=Coregonus suidteri TaxID=861788 RepID=A0AAN8KMU3_9TELE
MGYKALVPSRSQPGRIPLYHPEGAVSVDSALLVVEDGTQHTEQGAGTAVREEHETYGARMESTTSLHKYTHKHTLLGSRIRNSVQCSSLERTARGRQIINDAGWISVPRSGSVSDPHPSPLTSDPSPQMEERAHSFRRLKLMSSPSLSDLGKSDKAALEERGTQQRKAGANATWNSIHNAVIAVFQRKDLGENELYILNEGVRQLLKTELGSFFTEYLQNQLLTKGMVILRDKMRFYEGQKLLDSLAETWDFFFCDVLSMLQAIFYPVQGKEPSVRQLALLHFRNIITLNIKLEDALSRPRARVPPSIIQMLLILQGVHESKGVTEDYLRLEALVQKVVSPYLGTHGLYSNDGSSMHYSSCVLGS